MIRRKLEPIQTYCHPPGMLPTDSPARQAYKWGRLDRDTDELPQPEDHPGYEEDYMRGFEGLRMTRRHRRPLFRRRNN